MRSRRVLIIDDETMIGELVRDILSIHQFETDLVTTGREGIERARERAHALVVLDVMLPDLDGFEVCRQIRAAQSTTPVGIAILTGMISRDGRQEGFRAGADRFLTKPFQVGDLVETIESLHREYENGASAGLRYETTIELGPENPFSGHKPVCAQLARCTPLATEEIDAVEAGLVQLATSLVHASETNRDDEWTLRCQIYRDRLECRLGRAQVASARPGPDPLRDLIQLARDAHDLPVPAVLADSLDFPEDGSVVVMTKQFPKPTDDNP